MKFELVESKVQLGDRGYIRHKVAKIPEGELVQKCICCGKIISDHTPFIGGHFVYASDGEVKLSHYPEGYVFVSVQGNPGCVISDMIKRIGGKTPEDFIDCTVINS